MNGSRNPDNWLVPDWPAPAGVRAVTTTRHGGVSRGPYDSFNLGDHVGDDGECVAENRARLIRALELPSEPCWLRQVHGIDVVDVAGAEPGVSADASFSSEPGRVCAVLTADCLPVLLCDRPGSVVGIAHAGWRGLAAGVIERTVEALGRVSADSLLAWLGPAIGPRSFEVGEEVVDAFVARDPAAGAALRESSPGRWTADLYRLARQRLVASGVTEVYGGGYCTFSDRDRFFSYRRDSVTGRMASLIWLDPGRRSEGPGSL